MFSISPPPRKVLLAIFFVLLTIPAMSSCVGARPSGSKGLVPFTSDGCSLFPDGTLADRDKWCDCCQTHDLAYWQGGSADDRVRADEDLRSCVQARTGDADLAQTIYLGVRVGGHPVYPTWYRWGYGWPYGRGYEPLTKSEKRQVEEQLAAYAKQHPQGYCVERNEKP